MSKIESIQNEAEAIRARLNKQQEDIEVLFRKAKETGENLSPELMANFEKEKKNIAEINKKVDSISAAADAKKPKGKKILWKIYKIAMFVIAPFSLSLLGSFIFPSLKYEIVNGTMKAIRTTEGFSSNEFTMLVFAAWGLFLVFFIIRGIIRWIARTAKNA
jgi:hypothetical protein